MREFENKPCKYLTANGYFFQDQRNMNFFSFFITYFLITLNCHRKVFNN